LNVESLFLLSYDEQSLKKTPSYAQREIALFEHLPPFSAKRWRPKRQLRLPVGATAINALRPLDSAETTVRLRHLHFCKFRTFFP
ncbi:MAG: hypothetical protein IJS52_04270, partial [Bacilli bacterium]|nr:hypothetical protein [Bacilli bacterium]